MDSGLRSRSLCSDGAKRRSECSRPRNDGDTRGTIWTARNARLSIGAGCCRRGVARSPLPPPVRCWRPGARARRRGRSIVNTWGGSWTAAEEAAFFKPFTEATGIRVRTVAPVSYAKLKAQVQSGSYEWDVTEINQSEWLRAEREGLVEPIDWTIVQKDKLFPDAVFANGISYCALGTNLCYRKDKFPNGGPQSWADFWDVKKFPGSALALQQCAAIAGLRAAGRRRAAGQALSDGRRPRASGSSTRSSRISRCGGRRATSRSS